MQVQYRKSLKQLNIIQCSYHLKCLHFYVFYTILTGVFIEIFSSPELKAQVSFSDRLASVICPSVCLPVCLSVNFTSSSSSPEPLGQNWLRAVFGDGNSSLFKWRATPFPKGDNYEIVKIYDKILKNTPVQRSILYKFGTKHPEVMGMWHLFKKGPRPFPNGNN